MPRLATRPFGPALLTNSAATKVTVPSNEKLNITRLHVSNPTVSTVDFTMSVGADAAGTRMFDAYPIPPDTVLSFPMDLTLEEAEIIQAFASTTSVLVMELEGARLVLG